MPKPLEAIVVKATAVDRAGRYARAADLAEDIGRWIADEPVSAWREPWTTRTRRWAGRHRTAVTAAAAALVVAAAGMTFLSYESRLRAARRRTEASGRVDALITAQIRAIPAVVAQLGADRQLVRDRLRRLARGEGYAGRGRLPAALALLPDEPAQAEFLAGRLLDPLATPDEVLIIREALIAHRANEAVAPRCRAALPRGVVALTDTQLRAAGALAGMTPSDPAWTALADPIARKLARENPLHLGTWREIFAPIAPRLAGSLRKVFADRKAPEARDRAFTFLFEFATAPTNKTQADDLAALVGDSDPDYFTEVLGRLADPLLRERALAVLEPQIRTPAQFDDTLARRQGRIAMALLRLGRAEAVWPLFRHRDDPGVRTELVHNLARFGFDPAPVVARLGAEPDVSAQRALILCIGQFPPDAVADRPALASRLLVRYRVDSDPGVHGGIDWLLRQHWGRATDLEKIDKELSGQRPPRGHGWYVNGQGQTFAIFRDPVEFRMGSTRESDPEREENEAPHLRRIGRSFALATREVTLAEYGRFLDNRPDSNEDLRDNPQFRRDIRSPDCAVGALRWYKAAQYCNWLSGREGLPEDQWCYPEKIEPGMKLPADHLKRTGYRLPTEAEWEYACRAGAVSSRPYGGSKAWLPEFGWFDLSASGMMHPTGQKEPNDSGLFDMLGNAFEWCGDSYKDYPKSQFGDPVIDEITDVEYSDKFARVMRGGSFNYPATNLRSAYRDRYRPADRNTYYGVRPARTYP